MIGIVNVSSPEKTGIAHVEIKSAIKVKWPDDSFNPTTPLISHIVFDCLALHVMPVRPGW
jgi:hypothetical protein